MWVRYESSSATLPALLRSSSIMNRGRQTHKMCFKKGKICTGKLTHKSDAIHKTVLSPTLTPQDRGSTWQCPKGKFLPGIPHHIVFRETLFYEQVEHAFPLHYWETVATLLAPKEETRKTGTKIHAYIPLNIYLLKVTLLLLLNTTPFISYKTGEQRRRKALYLSKLGILGQAQQALRTGTPK